MTTEENLCAVQHTDIWGKLKCFPESREFQTRFKSEKIQSEKEIALIV